MKESSLVKRTLVVTGLLVGISTAWVALVSTTLVTVVDHAISSASGASGPSHAVAPSSATSETSAAKRKTPSPTPPVRGTTPNG